ncbi:hypothetical protein L6452_43045 [Arctium lappa]|uniref:Uncharacterized protein n=1 Tax=Arctium lappa TaxID=4217 RepID=A0ACB8XKH8_ARCLA|nr:hypothetical protein L6452_43045 [Arctium lappa]
MLRGRREIRRFVPFVARHSDLGFLFTNLKSNFTKKRTKKGERNRRLQLGFPLSLISLLRNLQTLIFN